MVRVLAHETEEVQDATGCDVVFDTYGIDARIYIA